MTSLNVTDPSAADNLRNRGATKIQLKRKPPTVAGNNHRAGNPQVYAAPLTPSKVHAEDELADALMAATQGPSSRPPR